jgi:D-glycero-alpha-D-manno-heptose 1-phosphate guanylyltransferase
MQMSVHLQDFSNLSAAILVGGFGTRLRAVVADRQKVLAEVNNRPFLSYILDQLASSGIQNVVLCTGYHAEQVKEIIGNTYKSLQIDYSVEDIPLGTAGAIRQALPILKSDPFLVLNGDSFCEFSLASLWDFHQESHARATLLLQEVEDTSRYGRVEVDSNGEVKQFIEKNERGGRGWINAGVYLLNQSLIQRIEPGKNISIEKDIFPNWIGQGLFGFQGQGRFLDIGTPESYALADQFFR